MSDLRLKEFKSASYSFRKTTVCFINAYPVEDFIALNIITWVGPHLNLQTKLELCMKTLVNMEGEQY